jgi:hypothetical protein
MFMPPLAHQRLLQTAIASPSQAITTAIKVEYTYSNGGAERSFLGLEREYDSSDKLLYRVF